MKIWELMRWAHLRLEITSPETSAYKYMVGFKPHTEIKQPPGLLCLTGRGNTLSAAIGDLAREASNKTLVVNAMNHLARKEYLVPVVEL